ncbi:MAG: citrate lyase subunit beta / citryl-CoA lyase [Frankiaceae bacterium]|nr:citrate lyase subunit beta / citryl-CoA lyase [Frankiaceae bacterium]
MSSWVPAGPALLFCPADRPERFAKAAAAADVVILDLEDGVGPATKDDARRALVESSLDPARTVVRVNPAGTDDHARDLEALAQTGYATVMLAKTESAAQVESLAGRQVIGLCETPLGVTNAVEIAAAAPTVALMWGAEDLVAGLGGRSSRFPSGTGSRAGTYRDVARTARSLVLLAAGAHRRVAIDAVHLAIGDLDGFRDEAEDAAACGFSATACIHPNQVEIVRVAYRPTDDQLDWARRVLAAAEGNRGVFAFEGGMVDGPVLRHAEALLARA